MSRITFIGLGAMGMPMAQCLVNSEHSVTGIDMSPAAVDTLIALGSEPTTSTADAIKTSDIVITMLPNGTIVRDVLFNDNKALEALTSKKPIVIDMSSSAPLDTILLAKDLHSIDVILLDAPVSGGVKRANSGSLAIMVGGPSETVETVNELLSIMGSSIIHTGEVGSGHAMKAINNFVSAAGLVAASEALLLGNKFGLESETMLAVLNSSSGKNNATENKMSQFVLSEAFNSGFSLHLMKKDLGIAANLADELNISSPMLASMKSLWSDAADQVKPSTDHTEIYTFIKNK